MKSNYNIGNSSDRESDDHVTNEKFKYKTQKLNEGSKYHHNRDLFENNNEINPSNNNTSRKVNINDFNNSGNINNNPNMNSNEDTMQIINNGNCSTKDDKPIAKSSALKALLEEMKNNNNFINESNEIMLSGMSSNDNILNNNHLTHQYANTNNDNKSYLHSTGNMNKNNQNNHVITHSYQSVNSNVNLDYNNKNRDNADKYRSYSLDSMGSNNDLNFDDMKNEIDNLQNKIDGLEKKLCKKYN